MEVSGTGYHKSEGKKRSLSLNEPSTLRSPVLDAVWSNLKRPRSTMMRRNIYPSLLEKQHENKFFKADASIGKSIEQLNVADLSLMEPGVHDGQKQRAGGAKSTKSSKKVKDLKSIADMSKIITKYDGAQRRYIGTTIELIKKDQKKQASGRAIWNRMPRHRLGVTNDGRQLTPRPKIDQVELNEKLKSSVAIATYELHDRRCFVRTMAANDESPSIVKSHAGTNTRNERVARFLTEAFEANADILGLGIPFQPKESKILLAAAKCSAENQYQTLNNEKSRTRLSCGSILYYGTETPNNTKQKNLKKVKISCIHFKPDVSKEITTAATFDEIGERCSMCNQGLLHIPKVLQAPPTTPIKKQSTKMRPHSLNKFGVNDILVSRLRTQTN